MPHSSVLYSSLLLDKQTSDYNSSQNIQYLHIRKHNTRATFIPFVFHDDMTSFFIEYIITPTIYFFDDDVRMVIHIYDLSSLYISLYMLRLIGFAGLNH